jgi:hypothetical protein
MGWVPTMPFHQGTKLAEVFAVDAGFDPYSFKLSNGPGSLAANAGVLLNQQTVVGSGMGNSHVTESTGLNRIGARRGSPGVGVRKWRRVQYA